MHEQVYETKKYKIIGYLKNTTGKFITVNKCVEIHCEKSPIKLKDFAISENLYFPKYALNQSNNVLYLLVIDFCLININQTLLKIFPTVFDFKNIKLVNQKLYLNSNINLLKEFSYKVLGNHPAINEMLMKIKLDEDFTVEDDLFEENEIVEEDYLCTDKDFE